MAISRYDIFFIIHLNFLKKESLVDKGTFFDYLVLNPEEAVCECE